MYLSSYLRDIEPKYDEVDKYLICLDHDIDLYEREMAEIKEADSWFRNLEPSDEEINEKYEESLRRDSDDW